MRLHRLLPIGRAFDSASDRGGRYQPAEEGMLPDFSERTARFRSASPSPSPSPSLSPSMGPRASGWGTGDGGEGEEAVLPSAASRPVASSGEPRAAAGPVLPRRHGWRLPLWLEQLVLALVRPGNRRRGTRPVQTELRFRTVQVARNDLLTADMEVVPVRPASLSAACRTRLLRLWWEQGAERLKRWGGALR